MESGQKLGTALITGASTGIGAVYAGRLASRGYDLILVSRNGSQLNALAREITDRTRRSVDVIAADLSDQQDLAGVEGRLRSDSGITVLVNNAGVASVAPLAQTDVDDMNDMIALNVTALSPPSSRSHPIC